MKELQKREMNMHRIFEKMNDGKNASFRLGHRRAMILSNATRALKKALKEEWQKRQNEKEHEKLVEESIDI